MSTKVWNKLYQRARRRTAVLRGLCVTCVLQPAAPKMKKCAACSEKFKQWKAKRGASYG